MADDLRAALIEAKLAGTKAEDGAHAYLFRSNETAAVVALDVFARWLRDEATGLERSGIQRGAIDHLRRLALVLTQPSTEEKR